MNSIFKTLAFAMLMPIMLLTTSCSSEDDAINTENTAKKGYTIPVTVNVTRQGDGATTRATYNSETKKLEFSAGDKLYVSGNNATAGKFAGTLDYVSDGKFSGTITTENEYSGTVDDLFAEFVYAILLPKDYASYGFFTYTENNGYDAALGLDYSYAFALTKAAAVEQFSLEFGTYSSGFALNPMCAVLNFTINGLAASTEVAVVFNGGSGVVSKNVTTDASGTATFAIGVLQNTDLNSCTLTVGGTAITLVSSSKTLYAGKIYNITRSAAAAARPLSEATAEDVGRIAGADGNIYDDAAAATTAGTTAVAMIAYVNGSNGLAIALSDEDSMNWSTAKSTCESKTGVGTYSWCLPSQNLWKAMFKANGGSDSSYTGLNTAITNAGGTALQERNYWSSTGYDEDNAYFVDLFSGSASFFSGSKGNDRRVRAGLAF